MKEFYNKIQQEIINKRLTLNKLIKHGGSLGRIYENIIHSETRKIIPRKYKIYRGIIISLDTEGNVENSSKELDMIIVDTDTCSPLYIVDDFIITTADSVKIVGQIKGYINNKNFNKAKENLQTVKDIDDSVKTFFLAYEEFYTGEYDCGSVVDLLVYFSSTQFEGQKYEKAIQLNGEFEKFVMFIKENLT